MRILCYHSTSDSATQERIWAWVQSVGGWLSDRIDGFEYYIPEDTSYSYVLLLDPYIARLPGKDYIA